MDIFTGGRSCCIVTGMSILRRLLSFFRPRTTLIVMHLDDMLRVHPDQIGARCSSCGGPVGVYPSGQKVMRGMRSVRIVCNRCTTPGPGARLAPGAESETWESRDR